MTFQARARRRALEIETAPRERSADLALLVVLALVFAPILIAHVALSARAEEPPAAASAPSAAR